MGLRFRKSVTLCKGVRLNFGKSGISVTTGTRGFHNTYNFGTGKRTTSIGIPGTGISYVTTSGGRSGSNRSQQQNPQRPTNTYEPYNTFDDVQPSPVEEQVETSFADEVPQDAFLQSEPSKPSSILSSNRLTSIHFTSDEKVDWTETLIQDAPPETCDDVKFWEYCRGKAYDVLNGNIDTYLQIIQDVGPLEDLLEFGFGFECGTDNPNYMFVEFETKQNEIMPSKSSMKITDYNDLFQDYVCSCSIRVARDIFALLPVSHVIVHALSEGSTVLSVDFERRIFTKLRFQGFDASELVEEFKCNMNYDAQIGFQPVAQLEGQG